jgi:two-component system C4-dicarboxylate transport response regulator DctD
MRQLLTYSWPGNVRELSNIASRFVLGLTNSETMDDLPVVDLASSLPDQVSHFERSVIQNELRRQNGCVAAASKILGIPKKTLYDKLRKHELNEKQREWCETKH